MSDCCGGSEQNEPVVKPRAPKQACPTCGKAAVEVSRRTLLQHIKQVWDYALSEGPYYFCGDADCEVVYFSARGTALLKADVRTRVGIKEQDPEALLCYCFGVSRAVAASDARVRAFVLEQTRDGHCACDTANPSGRCCLKDFPRSA